MRILIGKRRRLLSLVGAAGLAFVLVACDATPGDVPGRGVSG
jgi:hypothetical protein